MIILDINLYVDVANTDINLLIVHNYIIFEQDQLRSWSLLYCRFRNLIGEPINAYLAVPGTMNKVLASFFIIKLLMSCPF